MTERSKRALQLANNKITRVATLKRFLRTPNCIKRLRYRVQFNERGQMRPLQIRILTTPRNASNGVTHETQRRMIPNTSNHMRNTIKLPRPDIP